MSSRAQPLSPTATKMLATLRTAALLGAVLLAPACTDYGLMGQGSDPGGTTTEEGEPGDGGSAVDTPSDSGAPAAGDSGAPLPDGGSEETSDGGSNADGGSDKTPPTPEAGCADGEREGFLSWDDYPEIAACSGAWSVGGVTRDDLAPTCGRAAGDDGSLVDGDGCSAADVCAEGWHVCRGQAEVASLAGSCSGAVPDGTPDKSLFFAVSQHSVENTVCDDSATEANDVFGCGNLGTQLGTDKDCGPLDRALASMQPDSCGFNEAEPDLGPWECVGGSDSHYAEGSLVTKKGCPGNSCSYDGYAVGSSDKGGVLCCRD